LLFLVSDPVDCGYRLDVVVENWFFLELKAIERLLPILLTPEHPKTSPISRPGRWQRLFE
jgi:hypothetical protein